MLIFYITAILYLFAGGYECRLTTFPISFALDVSTRCYIVSLFCFKVNNYLFARCATIIMDVLQANK